MEPVSAIIIVKNESENLKVLLPKLDWCDEIVVIDDYSDDDTVDICRKFGCIVAQRHLDSFGLQKQYAVSLTKNKWVFNIDADELPTNELIEEIKTTLSADDGKFAGYLIRIKHVFMKRVFSHSSESKKFFFRLFDKTRANFNSNKVHEKVETTYPIGKMNNSMIHNSYRDLNHYFEKANHYTSLAAKTYFEAKKRKNIVVVIILSPLLFFKSYFFDLNFMEGLPGFCWTLFGNWYRIVKYIKLKELYILENAKSLETK